MKSNMKIMMMLFVLAFSIKSNSFISKAENTLQKTSHWLSKFLGDIQHCLRMNDNDDHISGLSLIQNDIGANPKLKSKDSCKNRSLFEETQEVFADLELETKVTTDDGVTPVQEKKEYDPVQQETQEMEFFPNKFFKLSESLDLLGENSFEVVDNQTKEAITQSREKLRKLNEVKSNSIQKKIKNRIFRSKVEVKNQFYDVLGKDGQKAFLNLAMRKFKEKQAKKKWGKEGLQSSRHLKEDRKTLSFGKNLNKLIDEKDTKKKDEDEVNNEYKLLRDELHKPIPEDMQPKEEEEKQNKKTNIIREQAQALDGMLESTTTDLDKVNPLFKYEEDGVEKESKFRLKEVLTQIKPLQVLKLHVLFEGINSDKGFEIKNLNRLKEVAEEHVNNNDIHYDLDTIFSERIKKHRSNEDKYFEELNQKNQKELMRQQFESKNKYKHKISKSMRDELEGDGESEEIDEEVSEEKSKASVDEEDSWKSDDLLKDIDHSMKTFLEERSDSSSHRSKLEDMSISDVDDKMVEEIHKDPKTHKKKNDATTYVGLEHLKNNEIDVNAFMKQKEKIEGKESDFYDGIRAIRKIDDKSSSVVLRPNINEIDNLIEEEKKRKKLEGSASNMAMDNWSTNASMDSLDYDRNIESIQKNTTDEYIMNKGEIKISFRTSEVVEEEIKIDENDYFRYYYEPQYIFQLSVCQLFITELQAFQESMDINIFICQYFSSLLSKTEFLEYVEFAKGTLGIKLVEVFGEYEEEYSKILNKYVLSMHSESEGKLKENLQVTLPMFLDNLLTLIEEIANQYIDRIEKNFEEIIEPLVDQITRSVDGFYHKENIKITKDKAMRLVFATYPSFESNPDLYRVRIMETLRYYAPNLTEELHSDFYTLLPDLLMVDRSTLCHHFEIFGTNNFYSECGYLLMESGIKDKLLSKCRQIFLVVFDIISAIPGYCSRMGKMIKVIQDIYTNIIIDLSKNLLLYKNIYIDAISKNIHNFVQKRLAKVDNFIEMYQYNTFKKLKFTGEVKTNLFPLFNTLRFSLENSSLTETKIRIIDFHLHDYLKKMKKYLLGFSSNVLKIQFQVNSEIIQSEKSSFLKTKLSNSEFRKKMKYYCIISTDIRLSIICDEVFDRVSFPFLYKFYQYPFVFQYIISFVHKYLNDFDLDNNDPHKIIRFFKLEMRQTLDRIRVDLIGSLYLFDPELLESLDKEVLILIMLFAKAIQKDAPWKSLEKDILPDINYIIKERYLEKIKNYNVENGFQTFFKDMARNLIEKLEFRNIMYFDKLIIFFIREMLEFQNNTKQKMMVNLGRIYTHYYNWDQYMRYYIENFKVVNSENFMLKCNEERDDIKNQRCQKGNSSSPFVVRACPQFSSMIENGICASNCPDGYQDLGLFCQKPKVIFKKIYRRPEECNANLGCVKLAENFFIDKCPEMYISISIMCFPLCPYGTIDHGNSCKKRIISKMIYYY